MSDASRAAGIFSAASSITPIMGRQQFEGGAVPKPGPSYFPRVDYSSRAVAISDPKGAASEYRKPGSSAGDSLPPAVAASMYALNSRIETPDTLYAATALSNAFESYSASLFGLPPVLYGNSAGDAAPNTYHR